MASSSPICTGGLTSVVDEQGAGRIYNLEDVWWLRTARRGRDPEAEDRRRRRPCRGCFGWKLRLGLETLTAGFLYAAARAEQASRRPRVCWARQAGRPASPHAPCAGRRPHPATRAHTGQLGRAVATACWARQAGWPQHKGRQALAVCAGLNQLLAPRAGCARQQQRLAVRQAGRGAISWAGPCCLLLFLLFTSFRNFQ
jgi:hypothetical protein